MILWYTKECWVEVESVSGANLSHLSYEDYLEHHGLSLPPNKRSALRNFEGYVDGDSEDITVRELNAHY